MSRETWSLEEAAAHIHMDARELLHAAQRGEIEAVCRGDTYFFLHRTLDEWAQRQVLAESPRALDEQHDAMVAEDRAASRSTWRVASLLTPEGVELDLPSKTRAGALRDLTDLAERTGRVYDPDALYRELVSREEIATTALENGVAFPHPRFHDPYLFESSFLVYARARRPIYFGSGEIEPTRHFFLLGATDHELHLHALARLALVVRKTDLLTRLDAVGAPEEVAPLVAACETEVLAE